jgi:tRNA (guanine-N7-)-methyltransferase
MTAPESTAAESSSLIHRPNIMERLDFAALFSKSQPVELELGAGDGGFIIQYASLHPERNFVAVERLLGRLRKIDRKGRRADLTNLLGIRLEAGYLLKWMISPGSLSAVHVYFPDPWPKRRHWKRRLIEAEFVESVAAGLMTQGTIHARTDHAGYFEQIAGVFDASSAFVRAETSADLLSVVTDFETEFHQEGKPTLHGTWRRR